MIDIEWTDLKSFLDKGSVQIKYIEGSDFYKIFGYDGGFESRTILKKTTSDGIDFENNYKASYFNKISIESNPWASKNIPGYKLYRRVHGKTVSLVANDAVSSSFSIPYSLCKIDEVSFVWFPEGVTANFKVEHPTLGVLSQHAFNVPISSGFHIDRSSYDATLQSGLMLSIDLMNSTTSTKEVGIIYVLHEMVQL